MNAATETCTAPLQVVEIAVSAQSRTTRKDGGIVLAFATSTGPVKIALGPKAVEKLSGERVAFSFAPGAVYSKPDKWSRLVIHTHSGDLAREKAEAIVHARSVAKFHKRDVAEFAWVEVVI